MPLADPAASPFPSSPSSPPSPRGQTPALRRRRWLGVAVAGGLAWALAGCAGMDVTSVKRTDAASAAAPAPGQAVVHGRVRFLVDGQPMRYHLLNRPLMQLFDRSTGMLLSTPETDAEGRFSWQLPPADYGVAVIFGGMGPVQQPHFLPRGGLVFVNGIVDPGLEFQITAGERRYLGTVEVAVASKLPKDVWFGKERVFSHLLGIRVVDDSSAERTAGMAPEVVVGLMRELPPKPRRTGS